VTNGPIPVEILHTQGCGNWKAARDAVYRVAEEAGAAVELSETVVETQEAAEALRFSGSPTVRVRDHDVQPETEQRTDFGLG
jgi:K+-transporting ATPase c subunit